MWTPPGWIWCELAGPGCGVGWRAGAVWCSEKVKISLKALAADESLLLAGGNAIGKASGIDKVTEAPLIRTC